MAKRKFASGMTRATVLALVEGEMVLRFGPKAHDEKLKGEIADLCAGAKTREAVVTVIRANL